jgi:hypothetical protein
LLNVFINKNAYCVSPINFYLKIYVDFYRRKFFIGISL